MKSLQVLPQTHPLQLTKYVAPPFHKQAKYISPWFHYEGYRGGALGHDAKVSMN